MNAATATLVSYPYARTSAFHERRERCYLDLAADGIRVALESEPALPGTGEDIDGLRLAQRRLLKLLSNWKG